MVYSCFAACYVYLMSANPLKSMRILFSEHFLYVSLNSAYEVFCFLVDLHFWPVSPSAVC